MKPYILLGSLLFLFSLVSHAQQEEQFTQFMQYKQGLNPAYAGSNENLSLTAISRHQWLGFEGAPQTQVISLIAPVLNQRIGVGANIVRQSIGVSDFYTLDGMYAYRFKVPRGFLGIGIQASARLFQADFSQLRGTQPITQDEAIPQGIQSKFVPNFGAGLYYDSPNFYLGFSIPRLLNTNIDLSNDGGVIAREVSHAYFMTGGTIELSENLGLQPQVLLKYVTGAPLDADFNVSLIINQRFSTGISYRLGGSQGSGFGEAVSLLTGIQLSSNFFLGLSYDATLSELRRYNSGSLEGLIRYTFGQKSGDEEVDNPRYF